MKETNKITKLKEKTKDKKKSIYRIKSSYRCQHDTRYEKTKNAKSILRKDPSKRFRNTTTSNYIQNNEGNY